MQILLMFYFFSNSESIGRDDFPDGFIFGTASSAYQVAFRTPPIPFLIELAVYGEEPIIVEDVLIVCYGSLKGLSMKETKEQVYGIPLRGNQVLVFYLRSNLMITETKSGQKGDFCFFIDVVTR